MKTTDLEYQRGSREIFIAADQECNTCSKPCLSPAYTASIPLKGGFDLNFFFCSEKCKNEFRDDRRADEFLAHVIAQAKAAIIEWKSAEKINAKH